MRLPNTLAVRDTSPSFGWGLWTYFFYYGVVFIAAGHSSRQLSSRISTLRRTKFTGVQTKIIELHGASAADAGAWTHSYSAHIYIYTAYIYAEYTFTAYIYAEYTFTVDIYAEYTFTVHIYMYLQHIESCTDQ